MNLCSEYASLSKHLMLFLTAVFAFTAKPVIESSSSLVLWLYSSAFASAIFSFLVGYATLFAIFDDEESDPSEDADRCIPTPRVKKLLQYQYLLTVLSLSLVAIALIQQLWAKLNAI